MFYERISLIKYFIFTTILMNRGGEANTGIDQSISIGSDAEIGEFPWQVAIWKKDTITQIFDFICSGSIVRKQWVITSGKNFVDSDPRDFMIRLGKTNLNEKEPNEKIVQISKLIIHQEYNGGENDICLIKFREPLDYNNYVRPICLPEKGWEFKNMSCPTSGWGFTQNIRGIRIREEKLQKATLKIIPQPIELEKHIHSNAISSNGKKICGFDDGCPLQCLVDDKYYLAGISLPDKCAADKSEFVKASYYYDWIMENIALNED